MEERSPPSSLSPSSLWAAVTPPLLSSPSALQVGNVGQICSSSTDLPPAVFLSTVVVLFWYVSRQEFYRSYAEDQVQAASSSKSEPATQINFRNVISQPWLFHLAAFLNFLVTLAIFPTWFSLVQTTSSNEVRSDQIFSLQSRWTTRSLVTAGRRRPHRATWSSGRESAGSAPG